MTKKVSFIIPHRGREEMLIQTIESISQQEFELSNLEVIIVTQNQRLESKAHLESLPIDIRIFMLDGSKTISGSRNFGLEQAEGAYFAFLDADIELAPNWLSTMLHLLELEPKRVLVSAMQINGNEPPALEQIRTVLSNAELDQNVSFLPGRNLFLSAGTFIQVGGFPEHLITCEDYYFTDKVNQIGDLYYTSETNYVHLGEDKELKAMFDKEIWRGQSNLQSISGRRIPLREWPSFIVPVAILVSFLISLTCLAVGEIWGFILASLVTLSPILVYSLRLYKLGKKQLSFFSISQFYFCYFPARAIGTITGVFRAFTANDTKE